MIDLHILCNFLENYVKVNLTVGVSGFFWVLFLFSMEICNFFLCISLFL